MEVEVQLRLLMNGRGSTRGCRTMRVGHRPIRHQIGFVEAACIPFDNTDNKVNRYDGGVSRSFYVKGLIELITENRQETTEQRNDCTAY